MRFLLAAYDPAHQTPDGEYWVFSHSELLPQIRNNFYYDVAAKNLPKNPNRMTASDCFGGWAAIDDVWACWYRFFDGGRDLRGRPGRFVLLCAFCRRRDNANTNAFSVLESKPFQDLGKVAVFSRPLTAPDSLEISLDLPEIASGTIRGSTKDHNGIRKFLGDDAPEKAAFACANLPPLFRFQCEISRSNGQLAISVEVNAPSSKPSLISTPSTPGPNPGVAVGNPLPLTHDDKFANGTNEGDVDERPSFGPLSMAIPLWIAVLLMCVAAIGGFIGGKIIDAPKPQPLAPQATSSPTETSVPNPIRPDFNSTKALPPSRTDKQPPPPPTNPKPTGP